MLGGQNSIAQRDAKRTLRLRKFRAVEKTSRVEAIRRPKTSASYSVSIFRFQRSEAVLD